MLSWLFPLPLATPEQREWVDRRFGWLTQQFGESALRKARVILPSASYFPDRFDGKPEDIQRMMERVCEYMAVDPEGIDLYMYDGSGPDLGPGHVVKGEGYAAGLYQKSERFRIGIEKSQAAAPMSLVATLAHELAHVLLSGGGRVAREEEDFEPLTDLATVFLGLGIFGANSCVNDSGWRTAGWSGWKVSRLGYLSQSTWSYALARWAKLRGDRNSAWIRHLRSDIRAGFRSETRLMQQREHDRSR
jgi:hypothetical protein